ncbi:hypothetical protein HPP92_011945 [Vanilla planifolia]|uniref:Uncharacterized protein n=1 Tax=Vanilla planifolia TaxID=51239 RepID=A0A835V0N6_VANPL|nr:hypothetical protein HPP92_011945 [Vanilla planifolia]
MTTIHGWKSQLIASYALASFLPLYFTLFLLVLNSTFMSGEGDPHCSLHPKEVLVGVCALCLRERLLGLVSKRAQLPLPKDANRSLRGTKRKPSFTLPVVFTLSSFLQRFEPQHQKADVESGPGSNGSSSFSDSFISMKFEEDGRASWSNERAEEEGKRRATMVEPPKPRGMLRWHRKIGRVLQLARWRRPSMAAAAHAGRAVKVEGIGGRRGSARTRSRRRNGAVIF